MQQSSAESVALECFAWLAGDEELLPVFLGSSGANAADLRAQVNDPAFLASVLEFVTMDDAWIVRCCDARGLDYQDPMRALVAMQGRGRTHWT